MNIKPCEHQLVHDGVGDKCKNCMWLLTLKLHVIFSHTLTIQERKTPTFRGVIRIFRKKTSHPIEKAIFWQYLYYYTLMNQNDRIFWHAICTEHFITKIPLSFSNKISILFSLLTLFFKRWPLFVGLYYSIAVLFFPCYTI